MLIDDVFVCLLTKFKIDILFNHDIADSVAWLEKKFTFHRMKGMKIMLILVLPSLVFARTLEKNVNSANIFSRYFCIMCAVM